MLPLRGFRHLYVAKSRERSCDNEKNIVISMMRVS